MSESPIVKYRSALVVGDTVADRSYDDGTRCWNIEFNLGGQMLAVSGGSGWKIPVIVPLGEGDVLDHGFLEYTLTTRHRVRLSNIRFKYKPFYPPQSTLDTRLNSILKVRLIVANSREELEYIHDEFVIGDRIGVERHLSDVSDFVVGRGENVYVIVEDPVLLTDATFTKFCFSFHCSVKLDSDVSRIDV